MSLEKSLQYTFRIGSDNQYRIHWNGKGWRYELLAGGVIFDEQHFPTEDALIESLAMHGLSLDQFSIDQDMLGASYSEEIQKKMKMLQDAGIVPCAKHGLSAKNLDNTCEACQNSDYPDDFKGTEG